MIPLSHFMVAICIGLLMWAGIIYVVWIIVELVRR